MPPSALRPARRPGDDQAGPAPVGLVAGLCSELPLSALLELRDAGREEQDKRDRDRAEQAKPHPPAQVAGDEDEHAPPAEQLAEVVRMAAVAPEAGLDPRRAAAGAALVPEFLQVRQRLDDEA